MNTSNTSIAIDLIDCACRSYIQSDVDSTNLSRKTKERASSTGLPLLAAIGDDAGIT